MNKTTAVVLAAGYGKRMKSPLPKVLREICGQALIYYILRELTRIKSVKQIIIVAGYKGKLVETAVKKITSDYFPFLAKKIDFVYQAKMLGTADAVGVAAKKIKFKEVLVTCGDNPLIRSKTLSSFLASCRRKNLDCGILTAFLEKSNQLGLVVLGPAGRPKAIREQIKAVKPYKAQKKLRQVNSGTYYFTRNNLLKNLSKIKLNQKKREYFLTDIIEILFDQGKKIDSYPVAESSQVAGINSPADFCFAQEEMRKRIIEGLVSKGVKIVNPPTTIVEAPAKIGVNTTIYPFTFIEKGVIIGSNCLLGPFIHLRTGTRVKNDVQVGNFLEINRTQLGRGVKVKHFGYLGDAVVSEGANIGAGAVVANYDGKAKHKTYIKKNTLIGSNTVLIAPVTVGEGAVTGAGAVVTKDVKKNQVVAGIPARFLKNKEQDGQNDDF